MPRLPLALTLVSLMTFTTGIAPSQTTRSPRPKFEVASIKTCKDGAVAPGERTGGAPGRALTPGRLNLHCRTVKDLIHEAYVLFANGRLNPPTMSSPTPIEGGPAWINSDRFEINAKAETGASQEMMRGPMMQT